MSYAGTGDIYIKTKMQRILSFATHTTKMCLSDMDGLIPGLLQNFRHSGHIFPETFPVPFGRPERSPVIAFGINPVGDTVPCRILSGHN